MASTRRDPHGELSGTFPRGDSLDVTSDKKAEALPPKKKQPTWLRPVLPPIERQGTKIDPRYDQMARLAIAHAKDILAQSARLRAMSDGHPSVYNQGMPEHETGRTDLPQRRPMDKREAPTIPDALPPMVKYEEPPKSEAFDPVTDQTLQQIAERLQAHNPDQQ
jgi:hypothetical protein